MSSSVVIITLIEVSLLVGIAMWVDVLRGTILIVGIHKFEFTVAFLALGAINHYSLVVRGYGVDFAREFAHFKKSKKVFLVMGCIITILLIVASLVFASIAHRKLIDHTS
jgi:hypothetical protein